MIKLIGKGPYLFGLGTTVLFVLSLLGFRLFKFDPVLRTSCWVNVCHYIVCAYSQTSLGQ